VDDRKFASLSFFFLIPHALMSSFTPFPKTEIEQSIARRFEAQVARQGDRLAVRDGNRDWSYDSLNQYANHIACAVLVEAPDSRYPVGILCDQGAPFIAATLGILKAGSCYSPLDPSDTRDNWKTRINKLGTRILLTDKKHYQSASGLDLPELKVIEIESLDYSSSIANPVSSVGPDDLAYVYFTSGSTGEPKGVMDNQRNVLHNIMRYTNSLRISPADRLTLLHAPNFSACVSSQFGALLNGASVFPNPIRPDNIDRLPDWLVAQGITIYHSVPQLLGCALNESTIASHLRMIRLEGDEASIHELKQFNAYSPSNCQLVNGLGASETGISRQFFYQRNSKLPKSSVPVGYPVEDMDVWVVNDRGDRALPGKEGDIVIRSRYLSPGYWGDPIRTNKVFTIDPEDGELRTWKSGDRGVMQKDGCLEILGRALTPSDSEYSPGDMPVEFVEPTTSTEKSLAAIWSAVFEDKPVGRNDNFFGLGGDSIKAMKIIRRIQSDFDVQISSEEIFNFTTLTDLASLLDRRLAAR
jgi:non-ribosomal peptide synthetase component F/acyl carrier protein